MPKRLFLLDGSAIAYRSHFAFGANPLTNKKGMDTSACFGFAQMLLRIQLEEKPDYMAVVFDSSAPTFRHEKYPSYKATREKMPEELKIQLPIIQDMVEAMRIPFIKKDGFEADDIIGTLAYQAQDQGMEVYMVTGDKDFMQLLKPNIYMYSLKKKSDLDILNQEAPLAKWGVPVKHVTDLLALMGDASDNIPGIPGIGEKTAAKLIQTHGSLDQIYQNIESVTPDRIRQKLIDHKDQAYLCKELVTIDTHTPLPIHADELTFKDMDEDKVKSIFQELEFFSLAEKIKGKKTIKTKQKDYKRIETVKDLNSLIDQLLACELFAWDTETTSINPMQAQIVGISFSTQPSQAFYISFAHSEFSKKDCLEKLKTIFENPAIAKGGQNTKYDMHILKNEGVEVRGTSFDTMIASYLLDPNARAHGIDMLSEKYLNLDKISTQSLIGKGAKQISMLEVDIEKVTEYACEDADVALQLHLLLQPQLDEQGLTDIYQKLELPLVQVLTDIEHTGICVDANRLSVQSQDLHEKVNILSQKIFALAQKEFNLNSPKQLGPVLFEELKIQDALQIKKVKKTKTGYSTDQETLEKYIDHPIVALIIEYRNLTKLISTYIDALGNLIDPNTKRIHTSFNQTVAATGRLSSSDPNLQNIPIRTEEGRKIRKAFVACNKDWQLISADYSQIELRLLAHFSQDPVMLETFEKGLDIHQQTASKIFNVTLENVTKGMRSAAKTINFGIIYGMGPQRLARENKISMEEAKAFIENYFALFSNVQTYFDQTLDFARSNGFVQTILGRKRPLPEINGKNPMLKAFAERMAINTPLQGSAADLIKKAMIDIHKELSLNWQTKMLLQVHDELIFEAPKSEVEKASNMIREKMQNAMKLSVPLLVDVGVGTSWAEAH